MSQIILADGQCWDLLDPEGSAAYLTPGVIAHHLAHLCRFTGAVSRFYSVAEHSIFVCDLVRRVIDEVPGSETERWRAVQRQALMHDAAEAVLGDISTPLKRLLGEQAQGLFARTEAAICRQLGIAWPFDEMVHVADRVALHKEASVLMPEQWGPRAALSTLDQGWFETPMTDPARAFLQYWTMLTS